MSKYITKSLYVDYKKFPKFAWWKVNNSDVYKKIRKIENEEQKKYIIQLGQSVEDVVKLYLEKKTGEDVLDLFPDIPQIENTNDNEEDETWIYENDYSDRLSKAVEVTKKAIKDKEPLLYQPSFLFGNYFVRADFMVLNSDGNYDLIEVKAKTTVRKVVTHEKVKYKVGTILSDLIYDVSFQNFVINQVFEEMGINKLDKLYLCSLDKEYKKHGPIDVMKLLKLDELDVETSVTLVGKKKDREVERKDVLSTKDEVKNVVKDIEQDVYLNEDEFNEKHEFPGNKYLEYFGEDKIKRFGTVLAIPNGPALIVKSLYYKGRIAIDELSDEERTLFTKKSGEFLDLYSEAKQGDGTVIMKKSIKEILKSLIYPICFYDYETINVPIPILDNSYPYQQVVVQYSLHKLYPDGTMKHYGGILEKASDEKGVRQIEIKNNPNKVEFESEKVVSGSYKDLLEEFLIDIGDDIEKSSFVVWNKAFESKICNDKIGEIFQDLKDSFFAINEKTFDLMEVFSKRFYFDLECKGSASIKNVLPALVPEMSYEGMDIKNGSVAMQALADLVQGKGDNREKTIESLLKYCGQDSLAMVKIFQVLENL